MLETATTVLEKDTAEKVSESATSENRDTASSAQGKKSDTAYRTISEVAGDLNLPQHVLRFWESKFKQVEPMKRGGGRRYYAPKDVDVLKKIHFLLYTKGYTIKGAKKLLSSRKDISGELAGIEQKFKLFDPIVQPSSVPASATSSAASSQSVKAGGDDLFGYQPSNAMQTELKKILADLKTLRKSLI